MSTKFAFVTVCMATPPMMLCSGSYWSVSHYLDPSHKYKGLVDEFSFLKKSREKYNENENCAKGCSSGFSSVTVIGTTWSTTYDICGSGRSPNICYNPAHRQQL